MNTLLLKQYQALIENINYDLSLLANTSAFIKENIKDVSWAGFYLYYDDKLILGPFQGLVACNEIQLNRGVCGKCAITKETQRIANVHEFAGHIACDSLSQSELVIPIIFQNQLYGVLDLDSYKVNRFSNEDQLFFENIVSILETQLKGNK